MSFFIFNWNRDAGIEQIMLIDIFCRFPYEDMDIFILLTIKNNLLPRSRVPNLIVVWTMSMTFKTSRALLNQPLIQRTLWIWYENFVSRDYLSYYWRLRCLAFDIDTETSRRTDKAKQLIFFEKFTYKPLNRSPPNAPDTEHLQGASSLF